MKALQEAALSPPIYQEYYERYKTTGLPSRDFFEHDLLLDGKFNHNAVPGFVNDFLDTLEFSGLTVKGVILLPSGATGDDTEDDEADEGDESVNLASQKKKRKVAANSKQDIYSIAEGDIVLEYALGLTAESVEEEKEWFDLMIRKLTRIVKSGAGADKDE